MYCMIDRSKNRRVRNTSSNKNHWASKCKYHWIYDLRTDESGLIDYQAFLHWIQFGEPYRTTSTRYTRRAMHASVWSMCKCISMNNTIHTAGIICCVISHVFELCHGKTESIRHTLTINNHTHTAVRMVVHTSVLRLSLLFQSWRCCREKNERKKNRFRCKHILNFSSHICRYISIQLTSIVYDPLTKMHITTQSEMNTGGTFINFCTWLCSIFPMHSTVFFLLLLFCVGFSLKFFLLLFLFLRCRHRCCRLLSNPFFFFVASFHSNFIDVMWF